ncbi:hypothetical protein [Streptomyces sp. NPDC005805]|uniref:hypothetical protein n=1 Tax=Streptomyces sp. NPDC005805 TaxID=3157068 RepID=UPI0033FE095E
MNAALRRVALYVALPLAVLTAVGYGWYRWSDTGKGWRFEDRLAAYCGGLLPYEEAAQATGLDAGNGLPLDRFSPAEEPPYHFCKVAETYLVIAEVPGGATGHDRAGDLFDHLDESAGDALPRELGGGWTGYADASATAVVLPCAGKDTSVLVSAGASGGNRPFARLVTATAARAAAHHDCDTRLGGTLPGLPDPEEDETYGLLEEDPSLADGTCAGIPLDGDEEVRAVRETKTTGASPLERCVLGATPGDGRDLYRLTASFGPFAQRLRTDPPRPGSLNADSGRTGDVAWATAACPGTSVRAVFSIDPQQSAAPAPGFLRSALKGFAERAAKARGCTDLRLPR